MLRGLLRGRRRPGPAEPAGGRPERPYDVACGCGHRLTGRRLPEHQVHACPRCGRKVFILPDSNFHPPGWVPPQPRPERFSLARIVIPAAALGLLAMVLLYLAVWSLSSPTPQADTSENRTPRKQILGCVQQAKVEVSRGSTHLALELLNRAIQLRDTDPAQLTEVEHRELNQLQRQVALLTDLAPGGVSGLLEQAERAPSPPAWQARFRAEYQGRGVILDDVLRSPRKLTILGRSLSDLRQGQAFGRVVLNELKLLQELPLQEPQRWIAGARLKSADREGGAVWVIRLEPDSGVLFTEPSLLPNEVPSLPEDPEWSPVQQRQRALLETLPTPRPHR